jgi:anthranilate/para-aminobenzoate synthase component I
MPETEIPTDLLTPLGAYLALREGASGAFLLESVERGRLGRYSFVGSGSRVVSFAEAEQLAEPVVGYLGYDAVATFEPTVPLPEGGPDVPESLFLVPNVLLRFDHARGVAELLRGEATGLPSASPPLSRGTAPRGPLEREPSRAEHLRRVERATSSRS